MNQNKIISAILKVCLFWYALLLLIFPVSPVQDWFLVALNDIWIGAESLFVGGLAGIVIAVIVHFTKIGNISHALIGEHDGKIKFSIGKIPAFRSWDRDKSAICPDEFLDFLQDYENSYPDHARLFKAGIQILAAYRHIPASIVPGGHGGASLEKHSFNVLREALAAMATWVYKGQFTSSGYQTAAVQDKSFKFYPDPLIPLCALLHDIGKIECYKIINGETVEVKERHDEEGAKILSALPEFRALSKADRSAMTIAVGYYHHPGSIPLDQPDRPRALAVFILDMDIQAGKEEGGYFGSKFYDEIKTGAEPPPGIPQNISGKTDAAGNENRVQDEITASNAVTEILSEVLPEDQREQFTANRHYPVDVCTDALAVFIREYVSKPNFFGLKNGGVCFCQDMKMRKYLNSINKTNSFDDLHVYQDGKTARLTSFTLKVLWGLHDRGMLVSSIRNDDGTEQKFSPNIAVFDISGTSLDGSVRSTKFCLVFSSDVSPLLDEIENCPNPFRIVKNSLGDQYRQDKGKKGKVIKNDKTGIDVADFDPSIIINSVVQEEPREDKTGLEVPANNKSQENPVTSEGGENSIESTDGEKSLTVSCKTENNLVVKSEKINNSPIHEELEQNEKKYKPTKHQNSVSKPVQQNDW